ncbi:MAG: glutaredoxin family protein [Deltaproteobacteria bacterium]|nr:glutaredoxin family protein [Deltaproteobacteria bacterium]MBW2087144.1 glutaredoxin family protein [Deltaproteobacteria bacterium]
MAKTVKIYSSPTCPYCRKTKEFLTEKGVAFDDYDVTADQDALEEMKKISGSARSIPVISVDDIVMVGFDQPRLEEVLDLFR